MEWRDIDMEHEVISVRRTSNHTVRDGNHTDTAKREKSVRSLKLPPVVFDVLKELKAYNEEQRERLGTKWVESDRLFIKWNGEPMEINTPYEWLKNFCKENDMPFCGVHGRGTSTLPRLTFLNIGSLRQNPRNNGQQTTKSFPTKKQPPRTA